MIAWYEATNLRYGSGGGVRHRPVPLRRGVAYPFVKLLGADIIGEARQRTRAGEGRAGAEERMTA